MRAAIIADSHFDEGSRFDECRRIHDWIAGDVAARGVDLILHAGDAFERRPTARERLAFADWLCACAEIAPFVIVRGNHDPFEELAIFAKLKTRHPVIVEEAAGVHVVAGAAVACLAWPRKAALLAATGETGIEASEQTAGEALRGVLRGLGLQLAQHDGPRILLAHAMVRGSVTSTGQPLVGCDLEVGLDDLALAGADVYALGHIHKPQDWYIDAAPVIYPGSPRRTAAGEVVAKGSVLAEIEGHRVAWERVTTPAMPMLLVNAEWNPATSALVCTNADAWKWGDLEGAEVRLRYAVDAEHRDAAAAGARQREESFRMGGAVSVKVEEVVRPTSTARAPEIVQAQTVGEKLAALWSVRNAVPESERGERLLSMATALDEEVRHAAP